MKKVLFINWDNYPNNESGGVYTWEKALIDRISDYEFVILNLLSNPNANGKFTVPNQVKQVINIPLFGSNRYQEFYDERQSLVAKIFRTTNKGVIENQFIPLFRDFLVNAISSFSDPMKLAMSIFKIHKLMIKYDVKKCLEHTKTWDTFMQLLTSDLLYKNIAITDATDIFRAIQRNLQIIAIKIPRCDLVHCSLAWFPSLVAICAKMEYGSPILVTEHGVAFRELLLYYSTILHTEPISIFLKLFSSNIIRAVFYIADLISPVCYANSKWEEKLDADNSKIKVIYNGINVSKFRPMSIKREQPRPTIVYLGRIEMVKGVHKVIQSIKYVKKDIPDILCLVYGKCTDLDFANKCVDLVKELGLEDNVKFMGGTKEPEKAYNLADVVVNFSFAEGFPFSIIEAMACGKAIVATDVGGVSEALENCGIVLKSSSDPSEFANAMVRILSDDNLRYELEVSALRKAKEVFSEEKMLEQFRTTYWNLICNKHTASSNKDQQLQFERLQYPPQQARGTTQRRMPI